MPSTPRSSPRQVSPGQDEEQPIDDVPEDLKREDADKGVGLEAKVIPTEVRVQILRHGVCAHIAGTGEIVDGRY